MYSPSLSLCADLGAPLLVWNPDGTPLELPALAFSLEFQEVTLKPLPQKVIDHSTLSGTMDHGEIGYRVEWEVTGGYLRKRVIFSGTPAPGWGALLRLVVHEGELPDEAVVDASMGWRDAAFERESLELRKPEEGAGRLPGCGYPIFLQHHFVGLEHPMGFNEGEGAGVRLYHHPLWGEGELRSETMVIGRAAEGTPVRRAFADYLETIRKRRPERASVEINTFWTDPCHVSPEGGVIYDVDFPAYRAMAEGWIEGVLQGEQGLITSLVLDAGWQEPGSIYAPKAELGGPGDEGLASFAQELEQWGLSLGLWISVNGPVGTFPGWAKAAGYEVSHVGVGAGYSAGTRVGFVCLDDQQWVSDYCARLDALNAAVPVSFYKGDWDNDGILSVTQTSYPLLETAWEQNVNAMMRLYRHIAPRRADGLPGTRVRGGWWLSPWWLMVVDCTHLPHSGDLEYAALPALTPRDAALNSRDMLMYEHLVLHRSPVPWDAIISHDFASATRSPVLDTDESWLENLLLWIARGGQAIQLYVPPYGVRGWRAEVLRQLLRWFRDHEALLWKSEHQWLGGNPGKGEVYGYHHRLGDEELIIIRNPIGRPQSLEGLLPEEALTGQGWQTLYPYRSENPALSTLQATLRGDRESDPRGSAQKVQRTAGVMVLQRKRSFVPPLPERDSTPSLHALGPLAIAPTENGLWKVTVPYEADAAELILELPEPCGEVIAAAGRYPDGLSSAALPVTWLRSHTAPSYTEKRSGLAHDRWGRAIARIPLPVSGYFYLSLQLPCPPTGAWLEIRRANAADPAGSRELPLPKEARFSIEVTDAFVD